MRLPLVLLSLLLERSLQVAVKRNSLPFLDEEEDSSPQPTNLFMEYMSRGLLECTASYMQTISELQRLIKKAYEEHAACQEKMQAKDKDFPRTNIDAIDELLAEWELEELENASQPEASEPAPTAFSTAPPPASKEEALSIEAEASSTTTPASRQQQQHQHQEHEKQQRRRKRERSALVAHHQR